MFTLTGANAFMVFRVLTLFTFSFIFFTSSSPPLLLACEEGLFKVALVNASTSDASLKIYTKCLSQNDSRIIQGCDTGPLPASAHSVTVL